MEQQLEKSTVRRRVVQYMALAFGSTWAIGGLMALLGVDASSGPPYLIMAGACMLGPALAALVMRWSTNGPWSQIGLPLRGTRWPVVAATVLFGVLIVPTYLLLSHLLGTVPGVAQVDLSTSGLIAQVTAAFEGAGIEPSQDTLDRLSSVPAWLVLVGVLLAAVLAASTVNLPFMLGEELGWRGYLWHVLQDTPAWQRILFTGVVWGLWHAPLIAMGHNYPGHPVSGIGMMVLLCTAMALPFDWTRTRSGSVWSSALLHGIINGSAGASVLFAAGGYVLMGSIVGVVGITALLLLGGAIVLLDGRYRAHLMGAPLPGRIPV